MSKSIDKKDEALSTERALKQALEYLRDNQHYIADNERHVYVMEYNAFLERLEALAEQCVCGEPDTPGTHRTDGPCLAEQPRGEATLAPVAKPHEQQEPATSVTYKEVADAMNALYRGDSKQVQIAKEMENKRLYTSPPANDTAGKPWAGLTDEEFQWIYDHGRTPAGMIEMAEAKLREKNEHREKNAQPAHPNKPLTREKVRELLSEAGYDSANVQARTDFIAGIRHAEAAHGIKGDA